MPRVGERYAGELREIERRQEQEEMIADALRAREEFDAGFRRSAKGNLCRSWDGCTVTVFTKRGGGFGWVISGEAGPSFSDDVFDTEAEAVGALWYAIGGWV